MAFKETLTPIEGDNLDETKAEFVNMKFKEVHDNTLYNRQQISILLAEPTNVGVPISNGISVSGNAAFNTNKLVKKNGFVSLEIRIRKTDDTVFAVGATIVSFPIPIGYRYTRTFLIELYSSISSATYLGTGRAVIGSDGAIAVLIPSTITNCTEITLKDTYYVGGGTV